MEGLAHFMQHFIAPIQNRGLLKISGKDRYEFLQGLITNDIYSLKENQGLYSAFLTPQGKFLHDFFIYEQEEVFYLTPEKDRLEALYTKLMMYKLNLDITIQTESELSVYAMWGNIHSSSMTFMDPRLPELGFIGFLSAHQVEEFAQENGLTLELFEFYDAWRIRWGIPDGSRDMVPEKSIILENGLDELNAISWTKGCYLGQELTARTKHRGIIRKRLLPVTIEGPMPSWGQEIFLKTLAVGEMRSSQGKWGLALLRIEDVLSNPAHPVYKAGEKAHITPHIPKWMKIEFPSPNI